jgi:hypothetical protein
VKLIFCILLSSIACLAIADDLFVYKMPDGKWMAVSTGPAGPKIVGVYEIKCDDTPL